MNLPIVIANDGRKLVGGRFLDEIDIGNTVSKYLLNLPNLPIDIIKQSGSGKVVCIILAYKESGEVLLGDDGPLLITGPGLSGKQKVKNVVKIELAGL